MMLEGNGPDAVIQVATEQERIDFLQQVIAFNEGNIRAYDTKAQISLAAFVLSGNPLIAIMRETCAQPGLRKAMIVTFVVFVITILTYLWVLWPTASPKKKLTEGLDFGDLFYIDNPLQLGGSKYRDKIRNLTMESELIAEALKLSYIRKVKALRFKRSMVVTAIAYFCVAGAFFVFGWCS